MSKDNIVIKTRLRTIKATVSPIIMGILNVTPDSFYDGGKYSERDKALKRAEEMIAQGADIIDIGGESSRPGARPVSHEEETGRILPIISKLSQEFDIPISIDTWKIETARAAINAGAEIVNDITGLRNPQMLSLVKKEKTAVIAMHMRGMPWNMQKLKPSKNIFDEVHNFFSDVMNLPIEKNRIILDPGIGFGKTTSDNLILLNRIDRFLHFQRPILIGVSNKSFIGNITGSPVGNRLPGSLAATVVAYSKGAILVRTHNVAETVQALRIVQAILEEKAE